MNYVPFLRCIVAPRIISGVFSWTGRPCSAILLHPPVCFKCLCRCLYSTCTSHHKPATMSVTLITVWPQERNNLSGTYLPLFFSMASLCRTSSSSEQEWRFLESFISLARMWGQVKLKIAGYLSAYAALLLSVKANNCEDICHPMFVCVGREWVEYADLMWMQFVPSTGAYWHWDKVVSLTTTWTERQREAVCSALPKNHCYLTL